MSLLNGVRLLQLVIDKSCAKAKISFEVTVSVVLEAKLHFQAMVLVSRKVCKKNLSVYQNEVNSMLTDLAAQILRKAWNALTKP